MVASACPVATAALTIVGCQWCRWKVCDFLSSSLLWIPYCFAPAVLLSAILSRSYMCCTAAKLVNWSLLSQELGSGVLPHEKDFCTSKHSLRCHNCPSRPTPLPEKKKRERDILYPKKWILEKGSVTSLGSQMPYKTPAPHATHRQESVAAQDAWTRAGIIQKASSFRGPFLFATLLCSETLGSL